MIKKYFKYLIYFFTITNILIWIAIFQSRDSNLRVIACDVGQGDALLVQHKTTQILIDAGKGSRVLDCLSKYMPFWDRKIELAVITHPQEDHYGGFVDIATIYSIDTLLTNGQTSEVASFQELEQNLSKQTKRTFAKRGMTINLGEINLDIIYPSRKAIQTDDPNDLSIIFNLNYFDFDMLFTGDAGPEVWNNIIPRNAWKDTDVLKVAHHGSKNGITEELLKRTKPEIAVVSSGKNNRHGHPHKEILDILKEYNVEIRRTDLEGDIVIVAD